MSEPYYPVKHKSRFPLLPNVCKKIGLGLFLFLLLTITGYYLAGATKISTTEQGTKLFVKGLLIISFLFIIFSKEKIENYRTAARRKNALIMALVVAPLTLLFSYLFNEDKTVSQSIWVFIRQSVMWYLIWFYLLDYPWHIEFKKKTDNVENDLG